jgi:glycosyltransferase involved in cell wall biosynthesis
MAVPEYDVSVVIPAYRMEKTITRAIMSVISQPDIRPEVIVVVDASPDHTAAKAKSFSDIVVLVNERNIGASASRNRGLMIAKTPFVMFLDADDYVEGPLLRSLWDNMLKNEADLAFGPSVLEWPDGHRRYQSLIDCQNRAKFIAEWLDNSYVPPCAVLWRRNFLNKVGGWNEKLTKNQDGEVVFRAICSGALLSFCTSGLGVYSQYISNLRISTQNSQNSLESRDSVLEYILLELQRGSRSLTSSGDSEVKRLRRAIAREYYFCAVHAFDGGFARMGEQYLAKARRLGFHEHAGSAVNSFLARIFGVRRARVVRNALKRLGARSRDEVARADLEG